MSADMQLEEVNLTDSQSENTQSPDEWQQLDGRSQDRFQKLSRLKKEAEERARMLEEENLRLRSQSYQAPPAPRVEQVTMTPEEKAAADRLRDLKFAQVDDINRIVEERLKDMEGRAYLEGQHAKLETKYAGDNGYPTYNRDEVERYMRENGLYNPEKAYRDMYYDEIVQLEAKKIAEKQSRQPYSEKTRSRISGQEPVTPEFLATKLDPKRNPNWKEYYLKNQEKIKALQTQWRMKGAS